MTEHLAFDQLQSMDVAFDWAIAPGQSQSSLDRVLVADELGGEAGHRCGSGGFEPFRPSSTLASANDAEELACDLGGGGDLRRQAVQFL